MSTLADVLAVSLDRCPVVAILRATAPELALRAAAAAAAAGVGVLEITIETPDGRDALAAISNSPPPGLVVGAGTVRTAEDALLAAELGARFTVSPGLIEEVLDAAQRTGVPHLPGVATPSEALRAQSAGIDWLKAFPASVLGPSWIRAMAGPLPEVRFLATGGVTPQTAPEYLAAGAIGVGISLRGDGAEQLRDLAARGLVRS